MYVLYDDTRSSIHEMDDDRIMSRTCLSQATVGDHNSCAETHKTKTATRTSTEQAAQAGQSPPRDRHTAIRGGVEMPITSRGPLSGEVVPSGLRPR